MDRKRDKLPIQIQQLSAYIYVGGIQNFFEYF